MARKDRTLYGRLLIGATFLAVCAITLGFYEVSRFVVMGLAVITFLISPRSLFLMLPFTSIVWYSVVSVGDLNVTLNDTIIMGLYLVTAVKGVAALVKGIPRSKALWLRKAVSPLLLSIVCLGLGAVAGGLHFGSDGVMRALAVFSKQWLIYAMLPISALLLLRGQDVRMVFISIALAGLALLISIVLGPSEEYIEVLGLTGYSFGEGREGGFLFNPNVAATSLLVLMIVASVDRGDLFGPRVRTLIVAFSVFGIGATIARGVIMISLVMLAFLNYRFFLTNTKIYLATFVGVLALVYVGLFTRPGELIVARFADINLRSQDMSVVGRVAMQAQGLRIVAGHPEGIGPGSLGFGEFMLPLPLNTTDNQILDTFAGLGWLGGGLFFVAVFLPLRARQQAFKRPIAYVIMGLMLAGFFYSPLFFPSSACIYWLLLSMYITMSLNNQKYTINNIHQISITRQRPALLENMPRIHA